MTDVLTICLTAFAVAVLCAYVALEWLRTVRRRNDLWEHVVSFERNCDQRVLRCELAVKNLVTRVNATDDASTQVKR